MKGPFKKHNPVEEEKAPPGINVKQVVWIGALTAVTGTIVGMVVTEAYRHFRPKVPIPLPAQPGAAQNPGYPQPQLPLGWAPAEPNYAQAAASAFVPAAVQQVGAYPPLQQTTSPHQVVQAPPYVNAIALPPGAYVNPAPALPPAQQVPVTPQPSSHGQPESEPLTRPELAQWQRRLESWERHLERREPPHE